MSTDLIRELGFLTLGSRLKRLGERLQAQTQELVVQAGHAVPASHMPLLAALDCLGPMSVGGIAQVLGTSQPGITRQFATLQGLGLVASTPSPGDLRQRVVSLTGAGSQLVAQARRQTWPIVEAAVVDACRGAGPDLMKALTALEDALAAQTLAQRATRREERAKGHGRA